MTTTSPLTSFNLIRPSFALAFKNAFTDLCVECLISIAKLSGIEYWQFGQVMLVSAYPLHLVPLELGSVEKGGCTMSRNLRQPLERQKEVGMIGSLIVLGAMHYEDASRPLNTA